MSASLGRSGSKRSAWTIAIPVKDRATATQTSSFHRPLAAGLGVALVRASLVEAELASGRLVRLFSRSVRTRYSSFIVYPPRSKSFGKVQVFQQWLLEQARPVERKDAVIAQAALRFKLRKASTAAS